jgi:pimeloyl-ACP methyl ester carboxylesterase
LVLVGENDTAFLQAANYMSKKIPGAQHVIIPEAGHAANLDNVATFNKTILDFLGELNLPKG